MFASFIELYTRRAEPKYSYSVMRDGDQFRDSGNGATINPFVAQPVNGYTAVEIARLQARLDKQLGPEFIATRPGGGGGGKVSYIEAWKVIALANDVFGFNGWSSSVQSITQDYLDERPDGRYNLGVTCVLRVTLRDGTYHEDVGYGSIENCKGKAAAFEKCKKEGTTDALKRALRNFGNVLGNCLYDKQFLKEVGKMKVPNPKFDPEMLHRRPEFALPADHPKNVMAAPAVPAMSRRSSVSEPKLRTEESYGDELFDGLDFEEDRLDNYDNVLVDTTLDISDNSMLTNENYHPPSEFKTTAQKKGITQEEAKRLHAQRAKDKEAAAQRAAPPALPEPIHPEIQGVSEPPPDYQPSFMTSRSLIEPNAAPALFDPKIQSPILLKSGIDHSKSTPIKRPGSSAESPAANGSPLRRMAQPQTTGFSMATRSNQFRAPSKLGPTTAKRSNEVLAEHPAGAISMNGSDHGSAEKKSKV